VAANFICQTIARESESAMLSLSTGKDSLVCLDIMRLYFKRIVGIHYYIVDFDFTRQYLNKLASYYEIDIQYYPSPLLSVYLERNEFSIGQNDAKKLKEREVIDYARFRNGIKWCASGIKAADSIVRNAMMKSLPTPGINRANNMFYPIWNFKKRDVVACVEKMPVQPYNYDTSKVSSGEELKPAFVRFLKDNHPSDYKKLLEVWPLAEALLFRENLLNKKEKSKRSATNE